MSAEPPTDCQSSSSSWVSSSLREPGWLVEILANEIASLPEHLGALRSGTAELDAGDEARHRQGKLGFRVDPGLCLGLSPGGQPVADATRALHRMAFKTSATGSFQDLRVG